MSGGETTADLLMAAARGLRRRYLSTTARWEITPGQARALRAVCATPGIRLSALADALGIVPRSATEVVDALEERGLVTREPDPDDRRATGVVPTAEGKQVSSAIEQARAAESEDYLAALSAEERAQLSRILRRLV